jgi:hypothetical protein
MIRKRHPRQGGQPCSRLGCGKQHAGEDSPASREIRQPRALELFIRLCPELSAPAGHTPHCQAIILDDEGRLRMTEAGPVSRSWTQRMFFNSPNNPYNDAFMMFKSPAMLQAPHLRPACRARSRRCRTAHFGLPRASSRRSHLPWRRRIAHRRWRRETALPGATLRP